MKLEADRLFQQGENAAAEQAQRAAIQLEELKNQGILLKSQAENLKAETQAKIEAQKAQTAQTKLQTGLQINEEIDKVLDSLASANWSMNPFGTDMTEEKIEAAIPKVMTATGMSEEEARRAITTRAVSRYRLNQPKSSPSPLTVPGLSIPSP